ncbi:hypothetical protein MMC30_001954 [Trapelia coarctata]|nr:hypothetical protein [Trapelia coarctata]
MSPRTDSYLSVCLQKASKSPLHYRHGCVVVSGGKIIGRGFNDYRPGFNGVALKTGKLAAPSAVDEPAIAVLKQKQKEKFKSKPEMNQNISLAGKELRLSSKATFTPFETAAIGACGGGGNLATHWILKGPLALPGGWKNRALNYRVVVNKSYVYAASNPTTSRQSAVSKAPTSVATAAVAGLPFKRRTLKQLHVNAVKDKVCECNDNNKEEQKEEENKKENVWAPLGKSTEKVSVPERYGYHHQEKHQGHIHHHGVKHGQQEQQQQHLHRAPKNLGLHVTTTNLTSPAVPASKNLASGTISSESQSHMIREHLKTSPTILVPRARTMNKAQSVTDRMKDGRLRGADIYVARLGWKKQETLEHLPTTSNTVQSLPSDKARNLPLPDTEVSTGSLHEKLKFTTASTPTVRQLPVGGKPSVSASRPCYRCICYMHTVGIKRVFWTNNKGEWEGGKVRDMMDALDLGGPPRDGKSQMEGPTGGAAGNGVFVTKHEVLKLRRLMGS